MVRGLQKGLNKALIFTFYIMGFIVIGLFSGYLSFKLMSFSKTVEVPDLGGKTLIEANELISKKGLYLKIEGEEYDTAIPNGSIMRQDIPPGIKVKEQRGIKVILSKGPKVLSVPDTTIGTIEEAESQLNKSGLRVNKIIYVHSNSAEKGRVIAQRPNPDEPISESISLVVSSGPYGIIYYCPDFSGKAREEATVLAEKLGIKIEFSGAGETVKSQKPKPNSVIKTGETIYLQLEGGTRLHG